MSLSEVDAAIALNSLTGIGVNNFHNLAERFGSVAEVFRASRPALEDVKGIGPKTAEQISSCDSQKIAGSERKKAETLGIDIITVFDERYPRNLKMLHKSPPVIYVHGEIAEEDLLSIAIVGTRNPSPYGRISTEKFASDLASRKVTIVSGFARGVDTYAHRTALESCGRTIAVMGCGLDICYPPENHKLYEMIRRNGAAVSQFSFGSEPEKRNFPVRNRLICGFSLGVVVVEAGEKSGAAITAYAALEEGREVFAIPGRIDSPKSVGTNRLIQKGAKLITCVEDIIEEMQPDIRVFLEQTEKPGNNVSFSAAEAKIIDILEEEKHIDYIIENTGFASSLVLGTLLEMELKGLVRQLPGKLFVKMR